MATYLLTWNPARRPWGDLADEARLLRSGRELKGRWSCGHSRSIRPGDRFFLLRQGRKPRGIVASGEITAPPFHDRHRDPERRKKGAPALYVEVRFEALLAEEEPPLGVAELTRGPLGRVHWRTQISGIRIPDDAARVLEDLWKAHLQRRDSAAATGPAADAVREDSLPAAPPADESQLLRRITVNPAIFGGKPIVRGRRLAVEHVLDMLAAGDTAESIRKGYAWLEPDDIRACLVYARRIVANERIEPLLIER